MTGAIKQAALDLGASAGDLGSWSRRYAEGVGATTGHGTWDARVARSEGYLDGPGSWKTRLRRGLVGGGGGGTVALPESVVLEARWVASALDLADADPVTSWVDMTENGNDMVPGVAPSYVADDGGGRAAVAFTVAQYLDVATFSTAIPQPSGIYAIMAWDGTASTEYVTDKIGGSFGDQRRVMYYFSGSLQAYAGGTGGSTGGVALVRDGALTFSMVNINGGASLARLNDTEGTGSAKNSGGTITSFRIGASQSGGNGFTGRLYELGVSLTGFDQTQRDELAAYAYAAYGFTA